MFRIITNYGTFYGKINFMNTIVLYTNKKNCVAELMFDNDIYVTESEMVAHIEERLKRYNTFQDMFDNEDIDIYYNLIKS